MSAMPKRYNLSPAPWAGSFWRVTVAGGGLLLALSVLSGPAFAAKRSRLSFRPSWASSGLYKNPNSSFLADQEEGTREESEGLLDPKTAKRIQQQYDDLMRDYEMRKRYDLVGPEMQREQEKKVADFTRRALGEVRSYHVRKNVRRLERLVENDPDLNPVRRPLGVAVAVAAFYYGSPLVLSLGEQTRVRARLEGPSQRGQFSLASPWLDSQFDFVAGAPATRDPYAPPPLDPTLREERFRFSLSRGLPVWDLRSGVAYGSSTNSMTASISKDLFSNVTAVFDTTYSLRPDHRDPRHGEETVKLFYGFTF